MAARKRSYPWDRYWVKSGTTIRTGLDGFIADPRTTLGQRFAGGAVRLEELTVPILVALEGDAGLGKSRAVHDAIASQQRAGSSVVFLDAADFGSADALRASLVAQIAKLSASKDRPAFAYVDGIDAAAFGGRLSSLADLAGPQLRLRMVCRTTAWPARLRERLSECGAAFYELVPLTRPDIGRAAQDDGLNVDVFVKAVHQRNVEILASRPLTLLELLDEFHDRGTLPRSRTQLFLQACRRHSDEHSASHRDSDAKRADRATVNLRLAIIARLATFCVLCDCSILDEGPIGRAVRRLYITDLAGGTEVADGAPTVITENMVRAACRACGFISAGSSGGFTFAHRSFAEFLTAHYLHSRKLPLDQVRDVLCHPDRPDRVASQLRGVASALASMDPHFASWLVEHDSEAALAADFSDFSPSERAQLVDLLLQTGERVARVSIWSSWHVLASLVHPSLSQQLRTLLTNRTAPLRARDLAIDIAVACEQAELCGTLAQLATSAIEPPRIRLAAAYALLRLPNSDDVADELVCLLDRSDGDENEGLRGCALQLLWPDRVPNEPFSYILRPLRQRYVDSYSRFLSEHVPKRLRPDHLKRALRWLTQQRIVPHQDTEMERVQDAILRCAWQNANTAELMDEFVPILRRTIKAYEPLLPRTDPDDESTQGKPDAGKIPSDVRRAAALALCAHGSDENSDITPIDLLHCQPPLILAEDFSWLLDLVESASDAAHAKIWADAAERLFWFNLSAENADRLAAKASTSNQVRALLSQYVEPIDRLSTRATELREAQRKALQLQTPRPRKPRIKVPIEEVLAAAENRGSALWPNVSHAIAVTVSDSHIWSARKCLAFVDAQDEQLRTRILRVAKLYVQEHDDRSPEWISENSFPYVAFAGWLAFRLLAAHDKAAFASLEAADYSRWAAAILVARDHDDHSGKREDPLLPAAYAAAPDAFIRALRLRALGENVYHKNVFILRQNDSIWDQRLELLSLELLCDSALTDSAVEEVAEALLRHRTESGMMAACALVKDGATQPAARLRGIAAGIVLLHKEPEIAWTALVEVMNRDPRYPRDLLERFATRYHRDGASAIVGGLSPSKTADLYLYLATAFPANADPDFGDTDAVSPREAVGDLRDGLLRALASGGKVGSIEALERVAREQPQQDLSHLVREAEERVLLGTWHPITMTDLRALLTDATQRRLESAEQLLELVFRAISAIQERLHGVSPMVQFLWNTAGTPTPKEEAALSDFLKNELDRELAMRAVGVHREVEIRRTLPAHKGEKPDLVVAARRTDRLDEEVLAAVEVKGDWHPTLKLNMRDQLAERYLSVPPIRHGAYVVGWFGSRQGRTPPAIEELREYLSLQASSLSTRTRAIRAVVLNCSMTWPPQERRPRARARRRSNTRAKQSVRKSEDTAAKSKRTATKPKSNPSKPKSNPSKPKATGSRLAAPRRLVATKADEPLPHVKERIKQRKTRRHPRRAWPK